MLPSNKFGNLPEEKLFWLLAQKTPAVEEIKNYSIGQDFQWERFLNLGRLSGLSPLLFKNLKESQSSGVKIPSKVINYLNIQYKLNLLSIYKIWQLAVEFLNELKKEGIPVVTFKGLILAQQLYGDFALRNTVDLDIIILEKDFNKMISLWPSEISLDKRNLKFVQNRPFWFGGLVSKKICFIYKKSLSVDCHIMQETPAALEIMERAIDREISGVSLKGLSPEDNLIFLTDHFFNDFFRDLGRFSLKTLMDILNFMRAFPPDENLLISLIKKLGWVWRFYLLNELFKLYFEGGLFTGEFLAKLGASSKIKSGAIGFLMKILAPSFAKGARPKKNVFRVFLNYILKFIILDTWGQRFQWLITALRLKIINWQVRR